MKRTKKSARTATEIAAIRARLLDLAQGALGHCVLPDFDDEGAFAGMSSELGIDTFGRWVGAIQRAFGADALKLDATWMLEEYDDIDRAAAWLHERGVRA